MTHFIKNFITSIILMIGLSYGATASKSIDEYLHHNPEMALKLIVNQCIQDTNTNIDQAASLISGIVYNPMHKDALFPNTLSVDQNPNVSLLLASMAIIAKSSEFPWSTVQTILPSYNDNNQDHSIIFCEMTQSLFKMNIADQNQGYTFDETMQYVLR
ncbi:MAG: hypothetical protein K2X98_03430, partial [Alphaproteobacteria bacterium]|nr:hypothetical protein [Alphaproteobacteria bacterium]